MTRSSDLRVKRTALFAASAILALTATAPTVLAQDAGSLLQQVRPITPPEPAPDAAEVVIEPEQGNSASSEAFEVRRIEIVGNTIFPTAVLHALVVDQEGRSITLAELRAVAQRLTEFYREEGHILSRAIIPAQTIEDGTVVLQIVEARHGDVQLQNSSNVDDWLLEATLSPLRRGTPIIEDRLDQAILLLSDIPGASARAVLKPGADVGTADLEVEVLATDPVIASLNIDNHGNRNTGRVRLGGQFAWFNPLGHGDTLSIGGVTSGDGLYYGQVGYDLLLGGAGTRAGVSVSKLSYELGKELRDLDATGTGVVMSGWLRQPLVRSRQGNLSMQAGYDYKRLRDRIDVVGLKTDRHLDNLVVSLEGDTRDGFAGGGINLFSATLTSGNTVFDDAEAEFVDDLFAQTGGRFLKWSLSASRLQNIAPRSTLYATIAAQGSDANLDSAEKLTVGGPYSVRAYDAGALSGDTGYTGTIELRRDIPVRAGQRLQAAAFVDAAHVTFNRHPWVRGDNDATIAGAGVGLSLETVSGWRATGSVAARLGDAPYAAGQQSAVRGWFTLGRSF